MLFELLDIGESHGEDVRFAEGERKASGKKKRADEKLCGVHSVTCPES